METTCFSFASRDIFSADCIPFSKEFLSDFLFSESSVSHQQDGQGSRQDSNSNNLEVQDCHRSIDSEAVSCSSSNRVMPDISNYWLYQHRDNVSWKDQEDIDSSLSTIRCKKRFVRYDRPL